MATHTDLANLIWEIANLLRGPYRPPQYERVMLPLVVLRRFDCVLADTKEAVLAEAERRAGSIIEGDALDSRLNKVAGHRFHNRSKLDFKKLLGDPDRLNEHLQTYINGFSANVRKIFVEHFEFTAEIERMHEAGILFLIIKEFANVDLHPDKVKNEQMGLLFENLIRRFNELANETAGDHFTPREVITLMVDLLFIEDDALFQQANAVKTMLDPACGTGGMLAEAQSYMRSRGAAAKLYVYGQDYNKRAFATAASDMLMKQVDHNGSGENVQFGDTFTEDRFEDKKFDYFIANPPFGVDWKKQQKTIVSEHERGKSGRFHAGLPRVNDGSLLFLQHMISKFEDVDPANNKYGSRAAIVFSGSPLFTGGAGGGESNIRKWIIEEDMLEAIIALPEQMFYNTGIGTYIWIVTNRKAKGRKGKIQLVDARDTWIPMRRSQGDKRRKIGEGPALEGDDRPDEPDQIADIVRRYGQFAQGEQSKIFDNDDFGYTRVTVERPLRLRYQMTVEDKARFLDAAPHLLDDIQAIDKELGREPLMDWNAVSKSIERVLKQRGSKWRAADEKLFRSVFTTKDAGAEKVRKGKGFEPDPDLRDFENIPLKVDIDAFFAREVLPHVPDAWMDRSKDKVGYEINFNRHFYKFTPPRPLAVIDAELKQAEEEILRLLREVTE